VKVVFFLLGDFPVSEFYVPTFRYTKFRRWGITPTKEHNIQNTEKIWNQELLWKPYW